MSTTTTTTALPGLGRPVAAPRPETADDPRVARATRDVLKFATLCAQLGALLLVFWAFRLEERAFLAAAGLCFAGFAVHYWLPFRWKEPFWIGLSLGGAFVLLEPLPAALLIAIGLAIYAVVASPLTYPMRLAGVLAIAGVLMVGRATTGFGLPYQFWPVLGALFAFRLIVYLYDLKHMTGRPGLREYLSYFFILPNYYFLLFPVIDYQTLRRSYYQRDIHLVAQQGVDWIVRGAIQLLLYRLVYHFKPPNAPGEITSAASLLTLMVMTYLLYLRVSGQFHIIVGLLHLFGYDLPETHRRYLLARSLTDFWRRINIYWKDFMVKLVYFPVYFRLRRSGDLRAQVVATAAVFVCTWALHSYQWFWLRGDVLLSGPDTLFWAILGVLVIVNVVVEHRATVARRRPSPPGLVRHALQVAATFMLITTLWSLWNAPSLTDWLDLITWRQVA